MAEKSSFGKEGGKDFSLYTLKNKNGVQVGITELGAIITSIKVPVEGTLRECVLGFDDISGYFSKNYLENYPYLGAVIGRYGGRISFAGYPSGDEKVQLTPNHGEHHLHGGKEGFDKKIWTVVESVEQSVTLSYLSADGEEGYPGNLKTRVTYSLNDENELRVEYSAETDRTTPVNLTQHSYFNLNADSSDILTHSLSISAEEYVPLNENLLPTGELLPTKNSEFDFAEEKVPFSELDNSFVLNNGENLAGKLVSEDGKVEMEVSTSYPILHIYTGNYLPEIALNSRKSIGKNHGICFETQHFADSPNRPEFPDAILKPGEKYQHNTTFKFLF